MASPLVLTLSLLDEVHKKASQPAAWRKDAKCLVVLRSVNIIRPLHSARPFQCEPMRFLRAVLLQTEAGQLVQAASRTL